MDYTLNDERISNRNKLFRNVINNLVISLYDLQYKFFFVNNKLNNMNESISHADTLDIIQYDLLHIIITFIIDCKALKNLKHIIRRTFVMSNNSSVPHYYYLFEHKKFVHLFRKLEVCIATCEQLNIYLTRQIDRLKDIVSINKHYCTGNKK
ncbi:conserved Plasmodium protein, unknown function [Plasmodium malariae]|uniref:Uncharacterized protein n=1 Tax=Plasmodium malariae TaxID=5858 RepID=A0A1C3KDF5_PLAMA|nr:conserved Plasmodium protein, unknown function [Plasmodium malariae]